MQLKRFFFIIISSICLLTITSNLVQAQSCNFDCGDACSGRCGYATCTTGAYICNASSLCPAGTLPVFDCGKDVDIDDPYWTPGNYPDTPCTKPDCIPKTGAGCGCVAEQATFYCGPCEATPTPNPTSQPGSDPGSNPTSVPTSLISGRVGADRGAAISGPFCSQGSFDTFSLANWNVSVTNTAAPSQTYTTTVQGSSYSVNTTNPGYTFTVTLDLSNQTGSTKYVCSCPAPEDPNNPYLCRYTGVVSPNSAVNFYLKEYNLSNTSWFQVFGGNIFGRNSITNFIPQALCLEEDGCLSALSVPIPESTNSITSGFPIISDNNSSLIKSNPSSVAYHSYLNLASRIQNVNTYSSSTDLGQFSYDYFYKIAANSLQEVGNGEGIKPLFSDWTNSTWWNNAEVNYIKVNGNLTIDDSQGFNLTSNQKLVVFVDGNLTIDDSNPNDSNRKITSVAYGGFLAFFVNGNILITSDVGYELNPSVPSTPTVTVASSNLEGVFVADKQLIIQTKSASGGSLPDRKFIGAGTFIGWEDVKLDRTFDDDSLGPILNNTQAIDNFIYRPDFLFNWPDKLKASVSNWREVDPQLISN